jgi:type I restriction enzyme S subunit
MVGKCTELGNVGEEIVVSGLHTVPSRPMFSFASGYLGYFMNSPAYHTQLIRLMQGTKVLSISKAVLQDTAIIYPIDRKEQSKIGIYFSELDQLFTLHQHKYDKLVTIKKAMLEKMFPQNGAVVPEIRFKGFTEVWEESKLGEIVTFINGRAYSQNELLNKGKYKVLRVGNFYTNESWYYSDMDLGEKYYANKGDLLYTWSASFGPHIWHGDKVIYHYHIWKLSLSEHLDYCFAVHLLDNDKKKILNDKNGSTMVHITKAGMENKFVLIPKIEEQNKITNFLDNLDNLISLQQRELEKLKNIKKACLEKMFV